MTTPQNQTAFPLAWPQGWKRTAHIHRAPAPFFSTTRGERRESGYSPIYRGKRSMADAADMVLEELGRLGASAVVISTNVELRNDGLPYSKRRAPEDPGAAVYFKFSGKPVVLACDKWLRVEDNLWAIAKDIEAQRGRARWGVGNLEQAFAGYLRLAAPGDNGAATWYAILGCAGTVSFDEARSAYLEQAKRAHPDLPGGSAETMRALNTAWDQARQHFGR